MAYNQEEWPEEVEMSKLNVALTIAVQIERWRRNYGGFEEFSGAVVFTEWQ